MLTFVSNVLSQGTKFVTAFLITPILINGLGKELYGIWGMLGQMAGYFSLSDLRPAGTMKFLLSIKQYHPDIDEKKRLIGATLILWVISLPLMILAGLVLVHFSPLFIKTDNSTTVQVALGIVIFGVVLERLMSIPANILRAQNLEYKGMGLSAMSVLLSGALSAFAVLQGWGLIGLAGMSLLGMVISNLIRMRVAMNAVPWIGIQKPMRDEFKSFIRTSTWLTFSALSFLLLTSTDILLIGMLLGPSASAVYLTTSTVLRSTTDPLSMLFSSANAGIAGLCGRGEWERVEKLRREMYVFAIATMTIIGTGVLSLNQAFLKLWVGPGLFGGSLLNFLLVLGFLLIVLVRIDNTIVSSILLFREQAGVFFVGGVASVLVGILTMPTLGIAGMALGLIMGQAILLMFSWRLLRKHIRFNVMNYVYDIGRPLLVGMALFTVGALLGTRIIVDTWQSFILWAGCIGVVSVMMMWFVGLSKTSRENIWERLLASGLDRFFGSRDRLDNIPS
ncbi:MAG TPA: oligosaccharide flippase family protein [Anaerolineales bacterium]|nr:oligosaccharide flippase family protein [Anaerolineales bacterium]